MTLIYLINNSLTLNLNMPSESIDERREKRIISVQGEEEARKLANLEELQHTQVIYVSNYVMSGETAKYLAKKLELDIEIKKEIGERRLGEVGDKKIRMIYETQENDFDYKLLGGESLNDVKRRMIKFLKHILKRDKDKTVALFTHNVAITSLLTEYCQKGYNLDNRLILNYNDEAIIDGAWDGINVIELTFQNEELVNIKRVK